jgi:hypothetical protein
LGGIVRPTYEDRDLIPIQKVTSRAVLSSHPDRCIETFSETIQTVAGGWKRSFGFLSKSASFNQSDY